MGLWNYTPVYKSPNTCKHLKYRLTYLSLSNSHQHSGRKFLYLAISQNKIKSSRKSSDFEINLAERLPEFSTPCSPAVDNDSIEAEFGQGVSGAGRKWTRIILTGRTGIRAIVGTNNLVVCLDGVGVKIHARINYRAYVEDRRSRGWRSRVCDDRGQTVARTHACAPCPVETAR